MTAPIACPDCSEALVESSSERGDYFCPNCTSPVSVHDAVYYCRECGEERVLRPKWVCLDCQPEPSFDSNILNSFAALDCPGCSMMVAPPNYIPRPLHDGDGNYYVAHSCQFCGQVLQRSRTADGDLSDAAKENADRDPRPPADLSELYVLESSGI